jgi:acylphosphatase
MQSNHFVVTGRVQGVWYRQSTLEQARALQLTGWVRNRADGSVELVAQGDAAKLQELENWLWQGPAQAQVENVQKAPQEIQQFASFDIRY